VLRVPHYVVWPVLLAWTYGVLYFLANRAIYYPAKYPQGDWGQQASLGAEDVWLEAHDNVKLHAWWTHREGARLVTLFLHGNAGNITHRAALIREITAAGSPVLMLDYRGYGKSGGRPSEKGLYADSEAAYAYLLGLGYHPNQIILHGESLGTAVAIDLAARRPCTALVLEAPFSSASDVAGSVLPVIGPALVRSFNSVPKIRFIVPPKLFIHGDRDNIVPLRFGQKLFDAAQGRKEFWIVKGAGHNDILYCAGPRYRHRLQDFYSALKI